MSFIGLDSRRNNMRQSGKDGWGIRSTGPSFCRDMPSLARKWISKKPLKPLPCARLTSPGRGSERNPWKLKVCLGAIPTFSSSSPATG